jgi:hypothetical protein
LYLQPNYGFLTTFLPAILGNHNNIAGKGCLAAKILTSYVHMESITPAGRHAADQLLLRLRYLNMSGSLNELASPGGIHAAAPVEHGFDTELLEAAEAIIVEKRIHGDRPWDDIFDRPTLRSCAPKKGDNGAPLPTILPIALTAKRLNHTTIGGCGRMQLTKSKRIWSGSGLWSPCLCLVLEIERTGKKPVGPC